MKFLFLIAFIAQTTNHVQAVSLSEDYDRVKIDENHMIVEDEDSFLLIDSSTKKTITKTAKKIQPVLVPIKSASSSDHLLDGVRIDPKKENKKSHDLESHEAPEQTIARLHPVSLKKTKVFPTNNVKNTNPTHLVKSSVPTTQLPPIKHSKDVLSSGAVINPRGSTKAKTETRNQSHVGSKNTDQLQIKIRIGPSDNKPLPKKRTWWQKGQDWLREGFKKARRLTGF